MSRRLKLPRISCLPTSCLLVNSQDYDEQLRRPISSNLIDSLFLACLACRVTSLHEGSWFQTDFFCAHFCLWRLASLQLLWLPLSLKTDIRSEGNSKLSAGVNVRADGHLSPCGPVITWQRVQGVTPPSPWHRGYRLHLLCSTSSSSSTGWNVKKKVQVGNSMTLTLNSYYAVHNAAAVFLRGSQTSSLGLISSWLLHWDFLTFTDGVAVLVCTAKN